MENRLTLRVIKNLFLYVCVCALKKNMKIYIKNLDSNLSYVEKS